MTKVISLVIGAVLVASTASAQSAQILQREINRLAAAPAAERAELRAELLDNAVKAKLALDPNEEAAAAKKISQEFLAFRRADVQAGSGSSGAGTTSAVSSPFLPAIFGMAFESGALTRTISGNTVTLKVSPAGLVCVSRDDPRAVAFRDPDVCRTRWNRLGLTASFDTSRGEKDAKLDNLETAKRQFAELGARLEIYNKRQPRAAQYFAEQARTFANGLAEAAATILVPWRKMAEQALKDIVDDEAFAAASVSQRTERITAKMDALIAQMPDAVSSLRDQWLATLKAQQRADFNRTVVTAEYTYQQADLTAADSETDPVVPAGTRPPGVHTARIVVAKGAGRADFTFNSSVSFFLNKDLTDRLRDVRAALEVKIKMRDIKDYGAPTLSFAGLYVYLHQDPLGLGLPINGVGITEVGHIYLFQTKLEFPTANNAVRIPISISASNRSELIKESDVRGQIGISLNLDALFAEKK